MDSSRDYLRFSQGHIDDAASWSTIPSLTAVMAPLGEGVQITAGTGGPAVAAQESFTAQSAGLDANLHQIDASVAATTAQHIRQAQGVASNFNTAVRELNKIDKDIVAEEIGLAVKRFQREQTELQIKQAEAVEAFLADKFTNAELYRDWWQPNVRSLHYEFYKLAYELSKQAERLHNRRFGLPDTTFITSTWDPAHKGILAAPQLELQLRRLERAHANAELREFELVKTISLQQLDPLGLLKLKVTGRAEFDLPEWIYNLDHPGHYQRRIKALSLTIPAVIGPDQSVNATATLLGSQIRVTPDLSSAGKYERNLEADDPRFIDRLPTVSQLATSTGQDDTGVFQRNFTDEKPMPMEDAGAVCRIRIDLDPDCNPYEFTDIKLRVFYTARPGGEMLKQKAKEHSRKLLADLQSLPLARLFSMRHEFPTEWNQLRVNADAAGDHRVTIALTPDRFSAMFANNSVLSIGAVDLFGLPLGTEAPATLPTLKSPNGDINLQARPNLKNLVHMQQSAIDPVVVHAAPDKAGWTLTVTAGHVEACLPRLHDLLFVVHYRAARKA